MSDSEPLGDVRVLSIETYGAGSWATLQLADLGAEVIKIESPPMGDVSRQVPPGVKDGDSLFYQCFNRRKKSIALDLKKPEGKDAFHRLIPNVDILFSNPRGSMPEKLGLTYEHLKPFNPRIVCCFLTGWGRVGPKKDHPGYDYLAQAVSGMVWMGGEPDGPPARCGVSVVDMATGTNAAFLMLAGVLRARKTGIGMTVDTNLLETAASYANYLNTWHLNLGWEPTKLPLGAHQSIVPSQLFRTADGWLMVMAQNDKFYDALVRTLGRPELGEERFCNMENRYAHRDELLNILTDIFKSKTTAIWLDQLEGKVPVAPINSIPQAMADPQIEALDLIVEYDHPTLGRLSQTGPPFQFGDYKPEFYPGAQMGADTESILRELAGYTPEEIDTLRKSEAI